MRDLFPGYYPPSSAELAEMWNTGLVVLDASTLLNMYRYSADTRSDFVGVLNHLRDRLWIPHQVALEFQRNRLEVIDQQRAAFDSIIKVVASAESTVSAELRKYKRHSSLNAEALIADYQEATKPILKTLESARSVHDENAPGYLNQDKVWDLVTQLFDGRVGPSFSPEDLEKIYSDGRERYAAEIPPGYEDSKKGEPQCYGDLIVWKEIIRKASEVGLPAIFVTDDGKEDWWRIHHGKTLGPRVELVEEFMSGTSHRIHFYSPEQFLRLAKDEYSVPVSDAALGEVQEVSSRQVEDHVRNVIFARQKELLQQKRMLERSLARQDDSRVRNESYEHALAAELQFRALAEDARDRAAKVRFEIRHLQHRAEVEGDGQAGIEAREALMVALDHQARLEDEMAAIHNQLDHYRSLRNAAEREREMGSSRADRVRTRIADIDADLAEITQALGELDAGR
ncbi:MAG TPA: PIN-like domain-containing protein [Jatrophihabitans sp.]|nr:PIN-like domain-containing protein [Jatrophihabitans sp.]